MCQYEIAASSQKIKLQKDFFAGMGRGAPLRGGLASPPPAVAFELFDHEKNRMRPIRCEPRVEVPVQIPQGQEGLKQPPHPFSSDILGVVSPDAFPVERVDSSRRRGLDAVLLRMFG